MPPSLLSVGLLFLFLTRHVCGQGKKKSWFIMHLILLLPVIQTDSFSLNQGKSRIGSLYTQIWCMC